MSRSVKGGKGAGAEFWSRKSAQTGKTLREPGKLTKKYTSRYLRRNPKPAEDGGE